MSEHKEQHYSTGHTVVINQSDKQSNGIGTAGFVLAVLALVLVWIPILGKVLWILGLIFSFIGVFKRPRGLAVAGLVISLIAIVILIALIGTLAAVFAFS